MDENKIVSVKNRSSSMVVYQIREDGIRREFQPGETKKVPYGELIKLSYQNGGVALMRNFLQIIEPTAIQELDIRPENEYYMSEADIVKLIKEGSLDQFLDCLDFAPIGVIDLLKQFSVSVPLMDYEKRKALFDKTGFDVDKAIKNLQAEKEEAKQKGAIEPLPPERRVKPTTESAPTRRRTTTQYNVVSKADE